MFRTGRIVIVVVFAALFMAPAAVRATNDPFWPQQWALEKLHVSGAWSVTRAEHVVVAVVDTGVDLKHPDLRDRLLRGKDFVDGDDTPQDENGHGTHMAGTIAAVTGNGIGIASVAPDAMILPVRVLDAKGQSSDPSNVAAGIRWAVDHGAKVVNLSLAQDGSPSGVSAIGIDLLKDGAIDDAIRYVTSRGAVAVVAAGNTDGGGKAQTSYAAGSPGAIVVGASTSDDRRAAYSNYGSGLDVLAPGGGSATDANFNRGCELSNAVVGLFWNPKSKSSDYAGACGTSVAVAHVSGIAALLMARHYTNAAAVARIERTAVDLGPKGKDAQTGWGRVDAARALGVAAPVTSKAQAVSGSVRAPAGGAVRPAGRAVPAKPSSGRRPQAAPPQALRQTSPVRSRGVPIGVATVLVVAIAAARSEARRRLTKRI